VEELKASTFLRNSELFTLEDRDVRVVRMSRNEFYRNRNSSKLNVAGVYIVYSTTSSESGIYIGEGDDVSERLRKHYIDKTFWDELLIFTSERMNIAFSKNVEYRFIKRARISSKYPIDNSVKGGMRKLGSEDREYLKVLLQSFYTIIELTDIDVFDLKEGVLFNYECAGNKLMVRVDSFIDRQITVLKGSIVGRAFTEKADLDNTHYESQLNGSLQLSGDVPQQIVGDSKVLGFVYTVSLKNENGVSLSQVFDAAAGG
jgi:hypothetical protein